MTNLSIVMRPYRSDDLPILVELWHEAKQQAYTFSPFQKSLTIQDDRSYFRNRLVKHYEIWVAEMEADNLGGFFALKGDEIDQIFVDTIWQRHGFGKIMLAQAKLLRPDGLRLTTYLQNREACTFYQCNGFTAGEVSISPPPENLPQIEYYWKP